MSSVALLALLSLGALDLDDFQQRLDGARLVVRGRAVSDGTFEVFEVLKGNAPNRMAAATVALPVGIDVLLVDDTPYRIASTPGGDAILLDSSGEDRQFVSPKDKRPRVEPEALALAEVKRMLRRTEVSVAPPPPPVVPVVTPPAPPPADVTPVAARLAEPSPAPFEVWPWVAAALVVAAAIGLLTLARRRR